MNNKQNINELPANFRWSSELNKTILKVSGHTLLEIIADRTTQSRIRFFKINTNAAIPFGSQNVFLDDYKNPLPHLFLDEAKAYAEKTLLNILYEQTTTAN